MFSDLPIMLGMLLFFAIALGSLVFLLYLIFRSLRLRGRVPAHVQTDLSSMMILFQTMRDVVREQKDLARQFNESIDRKVEQIRSIAEASKVEREELQQVRKEMAGLLESLRSGGLPLANDAASRSAQSTPGGLSRGTAIAGATGFDVESDLEIPLEDDPAAPPPAEKASGGALRSHTQEAVETNDLIDTWTGVDFVGDQPEATELEPLPPLAEAPKDAAASRDAFRALLDLEPSQNAGAPPMVSKPQSSGPQGDNGQGKVTPLQRRVYEYADVGMSVAQIAGELGVGKGEVRLIISLRRDRQD